MRAAPRPTVISPSISPKQYLMASFLVCSTAALRLLVSLSTLISNSFVLSLSACTAAKLCYDPRTHCAFASLGIVTTYTDSLYMLQIHRYVTKTLQQVFCCIPGILEPHSPTSSLHTPHASPDRCASHSFPEHRGWMAQWSNGYVGGGTWTWKWRKIA